MGMGVGGDQDLLLPERDVTEAFHDDCNYGSRDWYNLNLIILLASFNVAHCNYGLPLILYCFCRMLCRVFVVRLHIVCYIFAHSRYSFCCSFSAFSLQLLLFEKYQMKPLLIIKNTW